MRGLCLAGCTSQRAQGGHLACFWSCKERFQSSKVIWRSLSKRGFVRGFVWLRPGLHFLLDKPPQAALFSHRSMSTPEPHPLYYQCQRCTACCRWPGDVKVTDREISTISAFLNMPPEAFVQRYTRLRVSRQGLSLIDRPDHSCIFLEGSDCVINDVKPQQCRDFPNKWNFPGWRQVCDALPVFVENQEKLNIQPASQA